MCINEQLNRQWKNIELYKDKPPYDTMLFFFKAGVTGEKCVYHQ